MSKGRLVLDLWDDEPLELAIDASSTPPVTLSSDWESTPPPVIETKALSAREPLPHLSTPPYPTRATPSLSHQYGVDGRAPHQDDDSLRDSRGLTRPQAATVPASHQSIPQEIADPGQ